MVSVLLGHLGEMIHLHTGDGHMGGHDMASHGPSHVAYGGDDGHGTASAADVATPTFHFPFFSPLALATILGSTGAYGLIARHGLALRETLSLIVALPCALLTAYAATYIGWRVITSSLGSSQIRVDDLAGAQAEVL
ncbi:MAG: hypothetical protein MUF51_04265, partial [Vicinamibacteria bacterium]|nr:hypothetical protein [Vicinamibacteria bacterium]